MLSCAYPVSAITSLFFVYFETRRGINYTLTPKKIEYRFDFFPSQPYRKVYVLKILRQKKREHEVFFY